MNLLRQTAKERILGPSQARKMLQVASDFGKLNDFRAEAAYRMLFFRNDLRRSVFIRPCTATQFNIDDHKEAGIEDFNAMTDLADSITNRPTGLLRETGI